MIEYSKLGKYQSIVGGDILEEHAIGISAIREGNCNVVLRGTDVLIENHDNLAARISPLRGWLTKRHQASGSKYKNQIHEQLRLSNWYRQAGEAT